MVAYKQDKEYMDYVGHLIATPKVQKLGKIPHHYYSTRLEHSINVSYTNYKIAKKFGWDAKSTARGGLLHDLFFYDWRGEILSLIKVMLGFIHGLLSAMLRNSFNLIN